MVSVMPQWKIRIDRGDFREITEIKWTLSDRNTEALLNLLRSIAQTDYDCPFIMVTRHDQGKGAEACLDEHAPYGGL